MHVIAGPTVVVASLALLQAGATVAAADTAAAARAIRSGDFERAARLLERVAGVTQEQIESAAAELSGSAGLDDLLDAVAAAWSAQRVAEGSAQRLPDTPPTDARGLRMEICA